MELVCVYIQMVKNMKDYGKFMKLISRVEGLKDGIGVHTDIEGFRTNELWIKG